jgi:hypothetical protein
MIRGSLALRTFVAAACMACAWPAPARAGDVSLIIRDGRVTLVARDATVRQILTEWARVGKTRIVNLERVPGGPLTVELKDVPEARALQTILRAVAGYMAAPRLVPNPQASVFDRIVVMPTLASAGPAAPSAAPAAAAPRPDMNRRPMPFRPDNPIFRRGEPDIGAPDEDEQPDDAAAGDDEPMPFPARPPAGMRQPGMMPPQGDAPDEAGAVRATPQPGQLTQPGVAPGTAPGAPMPGLVVPVPSQPARPGQPPAQPPKPPGDGR